MTTEERKALAASLTPEERGRVTAGYFNQVIDWIACDGDVNGRNVLDAIDAALTEATKDRPKAVDLGPYGPPPDLRYRFIDASGGVSTDYDNYDYAARVANGVVFPYTPEGREAAEREARYTRAHRRLRQIAAVLNAGREYERYRGPIWSIAKVDGLIGPMMYTPPFQVAGVTYFTSHVDAVAAIGQLESEGISVDHLFEG